MNYKILIKILLSLSLASFVVGFFLTSSYGMDYSIGDSVGQPIGLVGLALSIIFTILLFTKEAVWNTWKKFGIWYIPLTALLIYITPTNTGGSWGFSMSIDREGVTMFLSALFVIISLSIIGIKLAKLKKVSTSSIVKVILSILVVLVVLSFL